MAKSLSIYGGATLVGFYSQMLDEPEKVAYFCRIASDEEKTV
jgi:hypothetical protein